MSEPVSGVQFPGYWEKYSECQPSRDASAFNLPTTSEVYRLNSLTRKQGISQRLAAN